MLRMNSDPPEHPLTPERAEAWIDYAITRIILRTRRTANAGLGDRDPHSITPADVSTLVAEMAADLKPGSVRRYITTLKSVLDYRRSAEPSPG
jgi:hypothetical protein